MIGIIGSTEDNTDTIINHIETDLYDLIKNVEPYHENEGDIQDNTFILMDISVDGYTSVESKELTYSIATNAYNQGDSIMDVGCGLGDLYSFMNTKFSNINKLYSGIDFNKNKIELSKTKYKDINTECMDFNDLTETSDYIFAINIFNDMIYNDMGSYLIDSIEKLYSITNKCLVFNILNEKTQLDADNDITNVYSLNLISDMLKSYDFFIHRTEYIYGESMIYIYKPASI